MDTEWAWLAGFLDGDGCIIAKNPRGENTYFHVRVSFTQKDPTPLKRIVELIGSGNIRCKGSLHHYHSLVYGNRVSAVILEKVMPFLVAKREQAEQAWTIITAETTEEQAKANEELKRLKHTYGECS